MKMPKILLTTLALAASAAALSAADAQANWDKTCKACHGDDGKGATPMGKKLALKDFTDAKYQATFTDDQATKAIKEGITKDGSLKMKAFGALAFPPSELIIGALLMSPKFVPSICTTKHDPELGNPQMPTITSEPYTVQLAVWPLP